MHETLDTVETEGLNVLPAQISIHHLGMQTEAEGCLPKNEHIRVLLAKLRLNSLVRG